MFILIIKKQKKKKETKDNEQSNSIPVIIETARSESESERWNERKAYTHTATPIYTIVNRSPTDQQQKKKNRDNV